MASRKSENWGDALSSMIRTVAIVYIGTERSNPPVIEKLLICTGIQCFDDYISSKLGCW